MVFGTLVALQMRVKMEALEVEIANLVAHIYILSICPITIITLHA